MSNQDIQLDLNQDQAGQVVQQNVPAGAQTTLAFRVEQSKLPDFWGQEAKDSVTAIVFIRKIDDLARTNNWNDTTTYANVANALKGFARDWLFATAEMLDWSADQLTWTNLKPRFQKQFATQTDDKLIIDGLSNLAMGLKETTGELLARITNTMVIIKESYAAYENKVEAPTQDGPGGVGYLEATATKWKNDAVNNMLQFFKMQLFRAALPGDLRKAVAQHNQNMITLDDMYQVATDTQRESGSKTPRPMAAVNEDSHSEAEDEEDVVAAFQNRRNNQFENRAKRQNSGAPQRNNRMSSHTSEAITAVKKENEFDREDEGGVAAFQKRKMSYTSRQNCSSINRARSGNNAYRNGKYCYYCKIQNHRQEECRKRIRENEPCKDRRGRAYWPKTYVMDTSSEKNEQKGQQPVFH